MERTASEYDRDNEIFDVSYDRNANYIPDEMEPDYRG